MINDVYLIRTNRNDNEYNNKINKIIEKSGFCNKLSENEKVVLKVHLRDLDDTKYVNKNTLCNIKKRIEAKNNKCSILGSDTLFHKYDDSIDELLDNNELKDAVNVEDEIIKIERKNELFNCVPIIKNIYESDSMIVLSHFKGHPMIGFSGSLKNIATGCTNIEGQIELHKLVQPFISKIACLSCNVCVNNCPEKAISVDSVAKINKEICTGCNRCINSCPKNAIKINKITSSTFMKGLTEFSDSILYNKKNNKVLFINILINIKPYYNCNNDTNKVLSNDIGLLASFDPVAIDKASYDLINNNGNLKNNMENEPVDKFKEIWQNVDGTLQFEFAEKYGIGTIKYNLIEL